MGGGVGVRQGSRIKVMHAPRISAKLKKSNSQGSAVNFYFCFFFFFGITHLNYHGLLQFGYCWLCSIFLLLNGKKPLLMQRFERNWFPATALLLRYSLWLLGSMLIQKSPRHHQGVLLLLIYTSYWRNYIFWVYHREIIFNDYRNTNP